MVMMTSRLAAQPDLAAEYLFQNASVDAKF